MRYLLIALMAAGAPAMAQDAENGPRFLLPPDRIEDRIDRRESVIDQRYDRGPVDRIEDRIDRRESIADITEDSPGRLDERIERRQDRREEYDDNPLLRADRIEDQIDRRESRIDRRFDRGPLDRAEDVYDRRESVRDRGRNWRLNQRTN